MKYLTSLVLLLCALPLAAQTLEYRVLIGGDDIGHMIVDTAGEQLSIDFDFKQNGRGPTIAETMTLDQRGYPIERNITGRTTFGSKVDESFRIEGNSALWQDATGTGVARVDKDPHFYVDQDGSVYGAALLTRALLAAADGRVTVYPAGQATIRTRSDLSFSGPAGDLNVTAYELLGLSLNPALILLDQDREFFATASGRFSIVRKGYESADQALRDLAVQLSTERFAEIQKKVAQTFDSPVRIRNVRVFEPSTLGLTSPKDVVIYGNRITSVQPARSPASASEVIVDGAGGTLVAGMYEMHGHLGQENALLNIAAGVTSVRDMGNENDVLDGLIGRINRGEIAGPRITRSCFIEGKSEFSAQTGELVDSLQAGLDMVRWCASRDFHQVKFYNSMKPEWADALVEEAHRLGLRVAGHVPAFARADDMIAAGFDEITHANQLLLGWVLNDGEDTRTLFRFTAMKRFPAISRDGEDVQFTLGQMVERNVAHDPTIAIHEHGLTAVNGEVAPLARDIIDHLPTYSARSSSVSVPNSAFL
ncbi:MAG: amidohydrolase [Pseudomonadota bacterium]